MIYVLLCLFFEGVEERKKGVIAKVAQGKG